MYRRGRNDKGIIPMDINFAGAVSRLNFNKRSATRENGCHLTATFIVNSSLYKVSMWIRMFMK